MYRIETRISYSELIKEHPFILRKALPMAFEEINGLLGGKGAIERHEDIETLEVVMVGKRNDWFPWQVWPLI